MTNSNIKCGEVTFCTQVGKRVYALNCIYCSQICLQWEMFINHLEQEHDSNLNLELPLPLSGAYGDGMCVESSIQIQEEEYATNLNAFGTGENCSEKFCLVQFDNNMFSILNAKNVEEIVNNTCVVTCNDMIHQAILIATSDNALELLQLKRIEEEKYSSLKTLFFETDKNTEILSPDNTTPVHNNTTTSLNITDVNASDLNDTKTITPILQQQNNSLEFATSHQTITNNTTTMLNNSLPLATNNNTTNIIGNTSIENKPILLEQEYNLLGFTTNQEVNLRRDETTANATVSTLDNSVLHEKTSNTTNTIANTSIMLQEENDLPVIFARNQESLRQNRTISIDAISIHDSDTNSLDNSLSPIRTDEKTLNANATNVLQEENDVPVIFTRHQDRTVPNETISINISRATSLLNNPLVFTTINNTTNASGISLNTKSSVQQQTNPSLAVSKPQRQINTISIPNNTSTSHLNSLPAITTNNTTNPAEYSLNAERSNLLQQGNLSPAAPTDQKNFLTSSNTTSIHNANTTSTENNVTDNSLNVKKQRGLKRKRKTNSLAFNRIHQNNTIHNKTTASLNNSLPLATISNTKNATEHIVETNCTTNANENCSNTNALIFHKKLHLRRTSSNNTYSIHNSTTDSLDKSLPTKINENNLNREASILLQQQSDLLAISTKQQDSLQRDQTTSLPEENYSPAISTRYKRKLSNPRTKSNTKCTLLSISLGKTENTENNTSITKNDPTVVGVDAPLNVKQFAIPYATTDSYFCIFCKKLKTKLSKHLFKKHKNEEEVKKAASFPKHSNERVILMNELIKRGYFEHNTSAKQTTKVVNMDRLLQPNTRIKKDKKNCGSSANGSKPDQKNFKTKSPRKPLARNKIRNWTKAEKEAVFAIFGNLKKLQKNPTAKECENAIRQSPALHTRTLIQLRSWINHERNYR